MTKYSGDFFEAIQTWITGAGLRCDIGPIVDVGLGHLPYCVLDPHWVSEPDVGGKFVDPTAQYIGIQVNSYGKIATDALWLDQAIYDLLIDGPIPTLGVEIIYREADALPTLTWESTGVMLCKHWYRMTFR